MGIYKSFGAGAGAGKIRGSFISPDLKDPPDLLGFGKDYGDL
jgi:hypothetical protein